MRYLNGWVGDRVMVGISDAFGVLGKNDNGRRVKGCCVWAIHISSTRVYMTTPSWSPENASQFLRAERTADPSLRTTGLIDDELG